MRFMRAGLLLLAAGQLVPGVWALAAPAHFYNSFPGPFASAWVAVDGPFNHHLVVDAGAGLAATGVALALAAWWPSRRVRVVALVAYLVHAVAHLAGTVLITDWQHDHGLPPDIIKGALLISGMYDLKPVRLSARNRYVNFDDTVEQALSTQRHLDRLNTPVIIAYGSLESPEFQRQSRGFAAALNSAGKPVQLIVGEGFNHFEIQETLGNPFGLAGRAALERMATRAPVWRSHLGAPRRQPAQVAPAQARATDGDEPALGGRPRSLGSAATGNAR
jgi:hypothetical protein